jgi:hypothetical protein
MARALGLSKNAVTKAVQEGRITSFVKTKRGYEFDEDRAIHEYMENTNGALSSNDLFDDEAESDPTMEENARKSPLDLEPKLWTTNQAIQAKNIYQALKVKHELDVEAGKYYLKEDADKFWLSITNGFARSLLSLTSKLKQKHPELDESVISDLQGLINIILEDTKKTMKKSI